MPVQVVLSGEPAPGLQVKSANAKPNRGVIIGAESEIKLVSGVVTEGLDITYVQENFTQTVAISYLGNYTDLKETKTVEVEVVLEPDPNYIPPPADEEPVKKADEDTGNKEK